MASRIELWPLDRLKPYAKNARTHSDAQVAQIASSIVEYGFTAPLLVSGDGGILAGHGRLAAAQKLALDVVPVVVLDHLTPTQRRAYILADNQLTLQGGWNEELLAAELAELSAAGFDLALTGFSDKEIEDLLGDADPDDDTNPPMGGFTGDADEDIPDAPVIPVSRPGDIWQLGDHRLICGDSTDPAVVAALMAGERAALLFTSPPYANQRDYTTGGIANWDALMQGVFGAARAALREDAQILVNLGLVHRDNEWQPYWDGWIAWMRTQGWRRFGWYVWDQSVTVPGDWAGRLAPRHEFVFHFNRRSRKPNKIVPCKWAGHETHLRADGSSTAMRGKDGKVGAWNHAGQPTQAFRIPDSVIEVTRQRGRIGEGIDHPAVFPVGLPRFFIEAYTEAGEIVFEPFAGSGTTLLAGQLTGRPVRAIELAPSYTDVAVKRFQQNHPDIPVTLLATGQTFAEVEAERRISSGSAPAETRSDPLSPDRRSGALA
ncbi:site-specific DNA-methyltransferase [Tepidimonas sp. HKU79]|uniref:site-specific DNA-methyltransferase n=1 Tax=unclassified Tepidimonas TaxID=2631705 RepID=UPI003C7CADBE